MHIGPDVDLNEPAFIHDTALIHGRVRLDKDVSIWPYAVFRAEVQEIIIGENTNIQDHVMVHIGSFHPTIVGKNCSITHHVTLHGCEIGDNCLIGINATIMNGAKIGANSIVAGNSLVKEGDEFPENSIIGGSPAKLLATKDNSAANIGNAMFYRQIAKNMAQGIERLSEEDIAVLMKNYPKKNRADKN